MILNQQELKTALESNDISILTYHWKSNKDNSNIAPTIEKINTRDLKSGHKIRLRVGFLARTLSQKKWIDPKTLYNKRDGIVDFRKCNDRQYTLLPGESIIIYTNEVVTIGADYFGMILSRVSLEERGLVVSQSYVDPNWSGVLQLIVTNNSEKKQLLQEGCEIANLIIIKMSGSTPNPSVPRNEHYNVSWQTIHADTSFPKWQDRKRSYGRKILHGCRTYWVGLLSLGALAIITILYYVLNVIFHFF